VDFQQSRLCRSGFTNLDESRESLSKKFIATDDCIELNVRKVCKLLNGAGNKCFRIHLVWRHVAKGSGKVLRFGNDFSLFDSGFQTRERYGDLLAFSCLATSTCSKLIVAKNYTFGDELGNFRLFR